MRENSYKVISFPEMNFVPEPLQAYPAAVHRRFTGFTLLWQAPEGIFGLLHSVVSVSGFVYRPSELHA